ncbi:MAG: mannose-1-phosphate guanylyltransferase/mannose-6-phosphate isomerase, partial [Steroidobacteraceae bacterium]
MLTPVILSGGAGTRLWPLSRELHPKQLLALIGERTMLQETALRLEGLGATAPVVVCNEAHRFLVAEQLRQIGVTPRATLLEPAGRNTAPAIALAAHAALRAPSGGRGEGEGAADGADPLLLVLPADHVIRNVPAFHAAVRVARGAAEQGALVTFGIVPSAPVTGYGYIQRGAGAGAGAGSGAASGAGADGVRQIERFIEKPPVEQARQFVASGEYYWNSGMFLFRARRYLEELERLAPAIASACRTAFERASADLDFTRIDAAAFEPCPADSIDYAVMEKTAAAVVVPLDAGWSDVGSWSALHEASEADGDGNVARGDVICEDSKGCYLYSESRLVS